MATDGKYIWRSNRKSFVPLWLQVAYREWVYRVMDWLHV